jgi:UDP-glucose 4-epimerase
LKLFSIFLEQNRRKKHVGNVNFIKLNNKRKKMKNILITGAAGYIGQNLVKFLENEGCSVFQYDYQINANIHDLSKYDGVVHLAALSGIAACEKNLESAIDRNIIFAFEIFDRALEAKIPVVFTSSQAAKEPKSSIYAMMKKIVEIKALSNTYQGGDVKVLRLTNVYGGMDYLKKKNTVVKRFLLQKLKGDLITIHGDGTQIRDFIHVEDVCKYIWLALNYDGKIECPIDIGTGIGTSIIDLAKKFGHSYAFTDNRNVGTDSNIADITKAKELFEYTAPNRIHSYIHTQPNLLS